MIKVFVGREGELAALEDALNRAAHGQPHIAVVSGAAGLGKTSLVARFIGRHPDIVTVRAIGDADEQDIPYALLSQLTGTDTSSRHSFAEAGAALIAAIGALQESGPAIVWIDDAQWADAPSLRALVFAFRRLATDSVLLVCSMRADHEADMPDGFRRLMQRPETSRITVDALTVSDLEALCAAQGSLSLAAVQRLHEHTGGSPLHAGALLAELTIDELNDTVRELPAPHSYAVLVLARIATCSAAARDLICATSVLGMRCELQDAVHVASLDEGFDALDEAIRAGFLSSDGSSVIFVHPLIRAAVHDGLPMTERTQLHSRAAGLAGPDVLRHRIAVALAAGGDDALHDDLQASAVSNATRGRWEDGARYLFAASKLVDDAERSTARYLEAIDFLVLAGDGARAMSYMSGLPAATDAFRTYVEGGVHLLTGNFESAEALLRVSYEKSDPNERNGRAAGTSSRMSRLQMTRLRAEETLEWVGRARDAAFEPVWGGRLMTYELTSLGLLGRFPEAFDRINETAGSDDVDVLAGRGVVRLWTDEVEGAIADLTLAVAGMANPTNPHRLLNLVQLAEAEYRAGRWDAAAGHADLAASLADDTDQLWVSAFAHGVAALVPGARGQWEVADGHVREARRVAANVGAGLGSVWAELASIHVASARNEPTQVIGAANALERKRTVDGLSEPGVFGWRHLHAEALVASGDLEAAREVLDALEAVARQRGSASSIARAMRARGVWHAASGDAGAAATAFDEALELSSGRPLPFERAAIELAYGATLRRAGERRRAATLLTSALATFQDLGAQPSEQRCERELQACGLTPSSRKRVDVTKLTPSELSVARLVAEGRTNREVAAELVLSVKTIETHLGHVYAKLGVRSRAELAAKLQGPA